MDKKLMTKICFVAAMVMACGSAYASTAITGSVALGGGSFSPSNNVQINVMSETTSYAAYAGHKNGDRVFFTNSSDPRLYYGTKTKGSAITEAPTATETVNTSNFTSL